VSAEMRIMIIAAAVASLISMLTGIFSRVAFGTLLLRALLSGAGFAALSAGLAFLARRFLPEFFSATFPSDVSVGSGIATSSDTPEPEHRLNIVLPGDGDDQPTDVENLPTSADPAAINESELRDSSGKPRR